MGVVDGQLLWVGQSSNWNGCEGVALGMGLDE